MYLPFRVMKNLLDEGVERGLEMYLSLPHIVRGEMPEGFLETAGEWLLRGMKGFLVRNLESYGMLKREGLEKFCVRLEQRGGFLLEGRRRYEKYGSL